MAAEPVLLPGDPKSNVALVARGRAKGVPFEVGAGRILAMEHPREVLEAKLLARARRVAEAAEGRGFDWQAQGFLWNEHQGLWGLYFDSHNAKDLTG